jgi:hypothetical protein
MGGNILCWEYTRKGMLSDVPVVVDLPARSPYYCFMSYYSDVLEQENPDGHRGG